MSSGEESLSLTDVSLVDHLSDDALTIGDLLEAEAQEHRDGGSRLRDKYMHRVQENMALLKSIIAYPVSWWSSVRTYRTRRKGIHVRYSSRVTEHATYVQLMADLQLEDVSSIPRVEKEQPVIATGEKWQDYDCNGLGNISVVSATLFHGCHSSVQRTVAGLEWHRVRQDANTTILLFNSLDPERDIEIVCPRPESVFYAVYANPYSVSITVRLPHDRTTWWFRLLFRITYLPRLMQRFDIY